MNATASSPYSISGVEFNQFNPMSMVQQWNVGIQRQLPLALTVELNYVGNHALHLPYNLPVNIVPPSQVDAVTLANTTLASQSVKPYPTLSTWTVVDNVGTSEYDSLQLTVRRQFSKSLALLSNYAYSKNLDDGSTIYNFSAPNGTANAQYLGTAQDRARDWAVASIDARHVVNVAIVYTTPGPWWTRG